MTIYIINPNSSQHVTDGISQAVEPMRADCAVAIEARTLPEGPPGIESQADIDGVVSPMLAHCAAIEDHASAFVIACFSDPGLAALRAQSARPVVGIAEAGILTAMTLGQRFGIISILTKSIPRHRRYVGAMGVMERMAGDQALELGVLELADHDRAFARLKTVGENLRDKAQSDVIVLGCSGMTAFRKDLQGHLDLPVIDPCQAATAMAIGRVALNQTS
ncbi:MAG: aspartate/glutamate racemase family protein [Sulfitobacter sp.]